MEESIIIPNRGKIEITPDLFVKCYLGKEGQIKASKDIWIELKDKYENQDKIDYVIGDQLFIIELPITEKNISIVLSNGKKYKSKIYFVEDITNIIKAFKMDNPCFYEYYEYIPLDNYDKCSLFLNEISLNEIKDIVKDDNLSFEDKYNNFSFKESDKLEDINNSIKYYTKMDEIEDETYFYTIPRRGLKSRLNLFYQNKNRKGISDVIYGIFGNYASGKSLFLMYYNYESTNPSIYLNLKALKTSCQTKQFKEIMINELIILFHKLNKSYSEASKLLSKILPLQSGKFEKLILTIIEEIQKEAAIIILDQYKEELFGGSSFIKKLKKILFNEESNIKIIISSSMNNGPIAKEYLKILLDEKNIKEENNKEDNKENDYIPYHFVSRLVDEFKIKNKIKEDNISGNEKLNDTLKLFGYLPLYFDLCRKYINNLDNFKRETKKKIRKKITEYNCKEKNNLVVFDKIRKMIDNEIIDLDFFGRFIPFKYFYIEKIKDKFILRTHFPLINEIWDEMIMEETVGLFDGELDYDGDVIGSLLEFNLIMNIKDKKIDLDIDNFCKVNEIYNFEKFIESDTEDFKNKNMFITQLNQNDQSFDIAYVKGKNTESIKLCYIQVKKGYTNNRITLEDARQIYENNKKNFKDLFGFEPNEIYLVYVGLINNKIEQTFKDYDNYKNKKAKQAHALDKKKKNLIYSINSLDNFCFNHDIPLYYYWPNKIDKRNSFYVRDKLAYKNAEFDLFKKIKNNINLVFDYNIINDNLQNNANKCDEINLKYAQYKTDKTFLQKKRKHSSFNYNVDNLDMGIVFEFANIYFNNVKISNYLNIHELNLKWKYQDITNNKAIICLKLKYNLFYVDSFIYKDHLYKVENDEVKPQINFKLDEKADFIVIISFDSISETLKDLSSFFSRKNT